MPSTIVIARSLLSPMPVYGWRFSALGERVIWGIVVIEHNEFQVANVLFLQVSVSFICTSVGEDKYGT